jgi:starch synthase
MATPTRILFASGEVEPFARVSDVGHLTRTLPEHLQEVGDYDTRLMMPRYGTISERKNRLHEVIRLSGTDVPMGDETETLKVKVASIPDTRLQVYFMDSARYFKRKGLHADKDGEVFEDNAERALFFGRAVLETLSKLRWGPEYLHGFGWISGFLPLLLATEYADNDLFAETKAIFTPDDVAAGATITADQADALHLDGEVADRTLTDLGRAYADGVIFPPSVAPEDDAPQFSDDESEHAEQLLAVYDQAATSVLA